MRFITLRQNRQQCAVEKTELLDQRVNWLAVLALLDQAERYQVTGETQALTSQAEYFIDNIDLVKRVDYQPAIHGGLPPEVKVSKMVISAGDLYLLDSNSGKVLRAKPANQGYELDVSFQCGAAAAGAESVGSLIDMIAWPAGFEPAASVLGVDQGGNLAFCQPGAAVTIVKLALPEAAIGSVKAIGINLNELYVISQATRAVWVFFQKTYDNPPRDYFANEAEKPENLNTASTFVVDRDDLYILHDNGDLTFCFTRNLSIVPIRCQKANFVDMRPGRENLPMVMANPLTQLMISSPPDPSLFFLESASHSIYHFSLRSLVFQRHYMPRTMLSALPATAFTIYPERRSLFLAIGNEVYYGAIP